MIVITNKIDIFTLNDNNIEKIDNVYYVKNVNPHWIIQFAIVEKDGNLVKIQKQLSDEQSPYIEKEYFNLDNKKDVILLSNEDYLEVIRLIQNALTIDKYRKETIVNSFALSIAYECYLNYHDYEINDITIEDIFNESNSFCSYFEEKKLYKDEILNKAKEILKTKYKFNLDT